MKDQPYLYGSIMSENVNINFFLFLFGKLTIKLTQVIKDHRDILAIINRRAGTFSGPILSNKVFK